MKKIILAAIAIALLVFIGSSRAQSSREKREKKEKKISIKIITEEDGKKTVIDTSFDAKDDVVIEKFLKEHNVDKPMPPISPAPPLPPSAPSAATPPEPPSPPDIDDEHYSFHFDFDEGDFDELQNHLNEQMEQLKEQLEMAKMEIKISLEKAKISKEEMEHLRKEIIKELDKIDIKTDGDKKHKRIIIKEKKG